MRINSIQNYHIRPKTPTFKGNRDENQTLTPELREIFADKTVPRYQQKILWDLSEIPDFCTASKHTPKSDLLELSEAIAKSETNILDMALHGDIKVSWLNDKDFSIGELLPLSRIARRNKKPELYGKQSLLDIIKSLPIFQIEQNAKEVYNSSNTYPPNLILKEDGSFEIADTFFANTDKQKVYEIIATKFTFGEGLSPKDGIILFNKKIKGKKDNVLIQNLIPANIVEEEITTIPERLSYLFKKDDIKKSFYSLTEVPYFYNLIKETSTENIETLAKINQENEDIIARILKNKLTFDVIDPIKKETKRFPIIDTGKILLNQKIKDYPNNDFYGILFATTPVIALCILRDICKKARPDAHISSVLLSKTDNGMLAVYNLKTNDEKAKLVCEMPEKNYMVKQFSPFLNKAPFKTANINFDKK